MKIYITCTPEFSSDKLKDVVSLLKSVPGELEFIDGKPITQAQFKRLNGKFEDISQILRLNFQE